MLLLAHCLLYHPSSLRLRHCRFEKPVEFTRGIQVHFDFAAAWDKRAEDRARIAPCAVRDEEWCMAHPLDVMTAFRMQIRGLIRRSDCSKISEIDTHVAKSIAHQDGSRLVRFRKRCLLLTGTGTKVQCVEEPASLLQGRASLLMVSKPAGSASSTTCWYWQTIEYLCRCFSISLLMFHCNGHTESCSENP